MWVHGSPDYLAQFKNAFWHLSAREVTRGRAVSALPNLENPCRSRILHLKSKLVGGRAARRASEGHDRVAAEVSLRRGNHDDQSIRPGPPGRMGRFGCRSRLKGDCEL
jgi:hypothetical protein